MKNKKSLVAIVGALALVLIGGSFAYFFYTQSFDNKFHLGTSETTFTETFRSPDNWTPCTETPKILSVSNTSTTSINARIKITERWDKLNEDRTAVTGETLPLVVNNERMAVINFAHPQDWVYNNTDGYYYYRGDIAPNASTSTFIESVTFNCDATTAYGSARYHLVLTIDTISADADARSQEGWNYNF